LTSVKYRGIRVIKIRVEVRIGGFSVVECEGFERTGDVERQK
jgi:hypothetical protein